MNNKKAQNGLNWLNKTLFFVAATCLSTSGYTADATNGQEIAKVDQADVVAAPAKADAAPQSVDAATAPDTATDGATGTTTDPVTDAATDSAISDSIPAPVAEADPYESFNRVAFKFNDTLDIYFLKPIATFYNKVMPKPLNKGIHNVFDNINTVPTICDDILQANFYQAANDAWRLGLNTTVGIGGLFDVAKRMKLEPYSNDFGLTLARWGYTNSNYLVLPFFGPNTIRDGLIGLPVDYFAFSVYPYIDPPSTRYQVYALGVIDRRAQLLKFQDVLEEASYDKYVFIRNAYQQRRKYQIEQNEHRSCCDRRMNPTDVATPLPASDENYD
jgi:phospholipid-binding lipoprotein MlaA